MSGYTWWNNPFPDCDDPNDSSREPEDEEMDEPDVDVCLGCGRYYSITPAIETAWRESFNYREGAVIDQKCLRCMRGEAPPHEF